MIQRIALLAGGIGAAAVLALAMGAGNFFALAGTQASAPPDVAAAADVATVVNAPRADAHNSGSNTPATQPAQTKTKTVVDKVYIAPTPAAKVIHVTKAGPSSQPSAQPTTKPAPSAAAAPRGHDDAGYDDGSEQESEHDGAHEGSHDGDRHERGDD